MITLFDIVLMSWLICITVIYPLVMIGYYKLVKHSKMSIKEILEII